MESMPSGNLKQSEPLCSDSTDSREVCPLLDLIVITQRYI